MYLRWLVNYFLEKNECEIEYNIFVLHIGQVSIMIWR